jgi:hypothetical protein
MSEENKLNEGIFIVEGGQLSLADFSLSINNKGEITSEHLEVKLRFDVCPEWLDIAMDHLEMNASAAEDIQRCLEASDNRAVGEALKQEFRYGMQAIVASCIAIEAFYESIKELADVPEDLKHSWRKNRTAKYARIAETIKIAFNIKNESADKIRDLLKESFSYRDRAVHPNQDFMHPSIHPEFNRAVDLKFVLFRHHNAKAILHMMLSCIDQLCKYDRIKDKKIKTYSEQLLLKVGPMLEIWENKYGKLHNKS